jgi:hypothetical protein
VSLGNLNWGAWFYGLIAAVIGGGAGSVVSVVGTAIVIPGSVGLSGDAGWTSLKLMGVTFVVHAGVAMFLYLSKSPLPQVEVQVQTTKTTGIGTGTIEQTKTTVTGAVDEPPAIVGK